MENTPKPRPSPQEAQKYLDAAMKRFEEAPDTLEAYERRLLAKIRKASGAAQQAAKDVLDLKNQVAQAEARIRSLELTAENHQGSVNAYVDEVVSLKFGIEEPMSSVQTQPPPLPTDEEKKGQVDRKDRRPKANGQDAKAATD